MSLSNIFQNNSRILTFTIANSHFGIDAANILSFSDEYKQIQRVSNPQLPSFLGYLDYRDTLVNVYDGATLLNRKRIQNHKHLLITEIDTYKQAHIDWVAALERAISTQQHFALPRDPEQCAFGKWFRNFKTDDADLLAEMSKIEEPHQRIHCLADDLLELSDKGEGERAIRLLSIEKGTTLKKLLRTLEQIQRTLKQDIHPVIIYLTKDGTTPCFSLVLDEVDDIIDFDAGNLDTKITATFRHEPINGYLRQPSDKNYMLLCINKLSKKIAKITPLEDCIS